MTVIVAVREKDHVVMGGDSLTASRWCKSTGSEPKVFAAGGLLIGGCGSHRMLQLLRYGKHQNQGLADLTPPESSEDPATGLAWMVTNFIPLLRDIFNAGHFVQSKDGVESFGNSCFLAAFGNYLFAVFGNFQVSQQAEDYDAIGAGEDFALGSLRTTVTVHPGDGRERVALALRCVAAHSPYVSAPFTILSTAGKTEGEGS